MKSKKERRREARMQTASGIYRAKVAKYRAITIPGSIVALAVPVWAAQGVAAQFAGETTTVNVDVLFSVSISLAITTAGATAWGAWQRRRANRLDSRNRRLERNVGELQERLRSHSLPTSVTS